MKTQQAWTNELSKGLVNTTQLVSHNIIHGDDKDKIDSVHQLFDVRVPSIFIDKIKNGDKTLGKQFVPSTEELVFLPEELDDPIGDEAHSPVKGITHRYPNRVLLTPTYLCASYCRFCFRKNKVSNNEHNLLQSEYLTCLDYIKTHKEIWEVILTGGDPFTLPDQFLSKILNDLSAINHIKMIRFHSRVPSVLPSRVTSELIQILKSSNKTIWIVVHINSAQEFTDECKAALNLFKNNGFPLMMQSVLLKGVNDSFEDLRQLFETAVENHVRPYYLHYPDLAKGTSHFRVPLEEAQTLFASLRGQISGLCLPNFVLDIPGGHGKISIEKSRMWQNSDGAWVLDSPLKK